MSGLAKRSAHLRRAGTPATAAAQDSAQRRAGRREELLDAAIEVVRADGPRASMEALAAAGGVTKPILYRHFGDRDGLVAAIAERFLAQLASAIADSLRSWEDDPEGVLRTSIDAYLSLVEADNHLYRFLVQQQEARAGNRTTSEFVRRVSAQVADVLRGVWTMSGLDTANADLWAHAIVGMVHAAGDWWADGQAMSRSDVVAALTTLAGSGLDGAR